MKEDTFIVHTGKYEKYYEEQIALLISSDSDKKPVDIVYMFGYRDGLEKYGEYLTKEVSPFFLKGVLKLFIEEIGKDMVGENKLYIREYLTGYGNGLKKGLESLENL